jgi:16S rRNA (uracil1498-N3)-methyltransferase
VTLDRLQTVAQEACKQSGNPYLPIIAEPIRLDEWLSMSSESKDVIRLVGSLESNAIAIRKAFIHETKSLHLLIGPEGDFSEKEYARIRKLSWTGVRLAPYILRTEVAVLVMLAQCL